LNNLDTAHGVVFKEKYYISVPLDGASEPDHTFVYDIVRRSWSGPYKFGRRISTISDIDTAGQNELIMADNDTVLEVYEHESGTSDNGVAIEYKETTKAYDFGHPNRRKVGNTLITQFIATQSTMVEILASLDEGGLSTIKTVNISVDEETLPQTAPFTLGSSSIIRDTTHLEDLDQFFNIQFQYKHSELDKSIKKLGHTVTAYLEGRDVEDVDLS
jgi:hypothetical protein